MRKSIFILLIFIITIVIVICACSMFSNRTKYALEIINIDDILTIEITKDGNNIIITSTDKIADISNTILGVKRVTKEASISDYPANIENVITINITSKTEEKETLYLYKKNNKYFIEKPYNGIYQISNDEYDIIINYVEKDI